MYIAVFAIGLLFFEVSGVPWSILAFAVWNLLVLTATILAIVDAVRKARARETQQLATDEFRVKLVSIPFFILNFIAVAYLLFGGAVAIVFADPLVLAAGVTGIVLTYVTMLTTSIYLWGTIAQLRRDRIIGTGLTVLYTIMSLIFVTDIAAGVLVFAHARRRPRVAIIVLVIVVGLATIAFGILGHFGTLSFINSDDGYYPGRPYPDPIVGVWIGVAIAGFLMILGTVLISVIRRSALRNEAQRAALAFAESTESDTSGRVLPG
jgi:hypothetical protein